MLVDDMFARSGVSYYRCDACGHVWVEFADGRPIHHVTPLRDLRQRET